MAPSSGTTLAQRRACRGCRALPVARGGAAPGQRLPASWKPIDEHPSLRPGPWVPRGDMKGVVFCQSCETLWLLFLDPAHDYYTDVVELAPELSRIVSEDARLEEVLPLAAGADAMLQLMIRDWFALSHYDRSAAAEALVAELASPGLPARLAVRLLDFLAAVLAGSGRRSSVRVGDVSPLLELPERRDLVSLDPVRQRGERKEIQRLLAAVVRAAFGSAFGADHDRLDVPAAQRERLLGTLTGRESERSRSVLAPPGPAPRVRRLRGVERLALEIEDLLRHGANRVTHQEIAPLVEVVRSFWDPESSTPRWDPGLPLYRRCRDLLLALRSADLIPDESEREVAEVLSLS